MKPFEDGEVLVRLLGVAVDQRIGEAGQNLIVAGVRKLHGVRDLRRAAFRQVSIDLPFASDLLPEERQQGLSALFRRLAPELLFDGLGVCDAAVLLVDQRLFCAGKDLLPAQAVGRDQDDVLRFEVRCVDGGRWRKAARAGASSAFLAIDI